MFFEILSITNLNHCQINNLKSNTTLNHRVNLLLRQLSCQALHNNAHNVYALHILNQHGGETYTYTRYGRVSKAT